MESTAAHAPARAWRERVRAPPRPARARVRGASRVTSTSASRATTRMRATALWRWCVGPRASHIFARAASAIQRRLVGVVLLKLAKRSVFMSIPPACLRSPTRLGRKLTSSNSKSTALPAGETACLLESRDGREFALFRVVTPDRLRHENTLSIQVALQTLANSVLLLDLLGNGIPQARVSRFRLFSSVRVWHGSRPGFEHVSTQLPHIVRDSGVSPW